MISYIICNSLRANLFDLQMRYATIIFSRILINNDVLALQKELALKQLIVILQMLQSPTPGGLLSLSCGIKQKYTLQVYRKQEVERNKIRLFLSDGSAIMCAQTEARLELKNIRQKSMLRVELEYFGYHKPASIVSCEVLEINCPSIFGNPIPFIDFLHNRTMNSFADPLQNSASSTKTQRNSSNKEGKTNREIKVKSEQLTQKKTLRVEDIDRLLQKEEEANIKPNPQPQKSDSSSEEQKAQRSLETPYTTIADLYPKMRGWKLLARISWIQNKICTSSKGIKAGQKMLVINFRVVDLTGEVKCSIFDQAAHKFKDLLKKGYVYEFSGGTLIEEAAKSQNRFYPQESKTVVTVRFQTYSKIIEKNDLKQAQSIPFNYYKLTSFSILYNYSTIDQFDIAGFVKAIGKCEDAAAEKKKLTFTLANPMEKKQIEVGIYIDPEDVTRIEQNKIIVLKNIKLGIREDSLLFLRSCYNTQVITQFSPDEPVACQIRQNLSLVGSESYESLSQVRFYRRSLRQLDESLNLVMGKQNVYSKIHCYFMGVTDERKFTYEACYKCNKKISIVDRYSNFCPKCNKIVQIKQQYLLKATFADHTGHIKVAVMGDSAKSMLGICPEQFSKLSYDNQVARVKSTCYQQFVLSMRTCKFMESVSHSIFSIDTPKAESNLETIHRYLEGQIKFQDAV